MQRLWGLWGVLVAAFRPPSYHIPGFCAGMAPSAFGLTAVHYVGVLLSCVQLHKEVGDRHVQFLMRVCIRASGVLRGVLVAAFRPPSYHIPRLYAGYGSQRFWSVPVC